MNQLGEGPIASLLELAREACVAHEGDDYHLFERCMRDLRKLVDDIDAGRVRLRDLAVSPVGQILGLPFGPEITEIADRVVEEQVVALAGPLLQKEPYLGLIVCFGQEHAWTAAIRDTRKAVHAELDQIGWWWDAGNCTWLKRRTLNLERRIP